jgi:hypothetical protein
MSSEFDITLDYESAIVLKKIGGSRIIEFKRHPDPVLDNIVEMWKYSGKKGNKGKSEWIILKDLSVFLESYLNSGEYEMIKSETNRAKNNKKK